MTMVTFYYFICLGAKNAIDQTDISLTQKSCSIDYKLLLQE